MLFGLKTNFDVVALVDRYLALACRAEECDGHDAMAKICANVRASLVACAFSDRGTHDLRNAAVDRVDWWLPGIQMWLWQHGLRTPSELVRESSGLEATLDAVKSHMVRRCSGCGFDFAPQRFKCTDGKPTGKCNPCRTEVDRLHRGGRYVGRVHVDPVWGKPCLMCHEVKWLNRFPPNPTNGTGGVGSYCRPCLEIRRLRDPNALEKARAAAIKTRAGKPEEYRAKARIYSFQRRYRRKVTDDGTATPEFLRKLYATPVCAYCGKETPNKLRTADHVTPLIRGGAHSASNLVMACAPCNQGKRHRTAEEFLEARSKRLAKATQ